MSTDQKSSSVSAPPTLASGSAQFSKIDAVIDELALETTTGGAAHHAAKAACPPFAPWGSSPWGGWGGSPPWRTTPVPWRSAPKSVQTWLSKNMGGWFNPWGWRR